MRPSRRDRLLRKSGVQHRNVVVRSLEEEPVDHAAFDRLSRLIGSSASRRAALGGVLSSVAATLRPIGPDAAAKKKKKKCKKPKVKCGKKCCAAGQSCVNGSCVTCVPPNVLCSGQCIPGNCCPAGSCSGSTCCGQNQECIDSLCVCDGGPTFIACGPVCCGPTEACLGNSCGACPVDSDFCSQNPTLCGGQAERYCATSVQSTAACINDSIIECADCDTDAECTTLLQQDALCVSGACLAGCNPTKACVAISA